MTPTSVKCASNSSAHGLSRASIFMRGAGLFDTKDAFEGKTRIDREFAQCEGIGSGALKLGNQNQVLVPWDLQRTTKSTNTNKHFEKDDDNKSYENPSSCSKVVFTASKLGVPGATAR